MPPARLCSSTGPPRECGVSLGLMNGKMVIVTGASQGVGRALARTLAQRGCRLALAARSPGKLDEVVGECQEIGAEAIAVPTDVADEEACRGLVNTTLAHYGAIDGLVNNAGISMTSRFDALESLRVLERLMRVNYLGAAYCTFHALPHLKQSSGIVVAVSSLQGKTGFPDATGYAASKHAMQGFFDSLRIELEDSGVAVLVVSPGPVSTEIHARKLGADGTMADSGKDFSKKKQMSPDVCAKQIVDAMQARKRELVMTSGGKLVVALKPFVPRFVDKQVARAVAEFYR